MVVKAAVIVSALIANSALSGKRRNTPPSRDRGTAAKVRCTAQPTKVRPIAWMQLRM